MTEEESQLLQKAIKFSAKAHKDQYREGTSPLPYITHPIDVLNRLRYEAGVENYEVLCAAILHDVLEETDASAKKIEQKFGRKVRELVEGVTRSEPTKAEIEGMTSEEIWTMRSDRLLGEIGSMGESAWLIKLADRRSNLASSLTTRTGEKLRRYADQSEKILELIPERISPSLWLGIQKDIVAARELAS